MNKLSLVMIFSFVICLLTSTAMVFAQQSADDIFDTGAHVTQTDVDKIYKYEELMREYMAKEQTDKISDERYKEIIQQAGFANDEYFSYMVYRITMLRSYIMHKYNLREAEDTKRFIEEIVGGKVTVSNSEMAQMALERIGPPETFG